MVGTDPVVVEERLRSGMLRCPGCGDDGLAPWGHEDEGGLSEFAWTAQTIALEARRRIWETF